VPSFGLLRFDFALERVEAVLPPSIELGDPTTDDVSKSRGLERVESFTPLASFIHESCLLEHAQMSRDRGPRDVEAGGDVARGTFAAAENLEDRAPTLVGDGSEDGVSGAHGIYLTTPLNIVNRWG
jgi:hypothetical protein